MAKTSEKTTTDFTENVEFPSFERAQQFYNSAEYQAAKKVRAGAAAAQFILVEGI